MERGLPSFSGIFCKRKQSPCTGPACGHGPVGGGTRAGLGESAFPEPQWAPCPVSPFQAVGSQTRGAGCRDPSRLSLQDGQPPPIAKPRVPQNSGQVELRRSCWQWTTGLVLGPRAETCQLWCRCPALPPASVCKLTPWRGALVTSRRWHTCSADAAVSPTR